jgi:hypothetical protein
MTAPHRVIALAWREWGWPTFHVGIDIDKLTAWATLSTALATGVLATATFLMAKRTNAMARETHRTADAAQQELEVVARQAEAAQRQSEIAEAALGASIRPLIVDVPHGTFREVARNPFPVVTTRAAWPPDTSKQDVSVVFVLPESAEQSERGLRYLNVSAPMRNVGSGVAMLINVWLVVPFADGQPTRAMGVVDQQALPPGEVTYARFESIQGDTDHAAVWDAVIERGDEVEVLIDYTDLAGQQRSKTSLFLRPLGEDYESYFVYHAKSVLVAENPLGTPWG